ncbi:GNAT family N-acetyltransferase [Paenibacillus sacheonensis]|uniref:GNAT family N-acetyltransferase n=1 Tax=Paenibacillus sacheonensis TaxID=742054 RepID=UPI0030840D91|nr:GNAT superfamily N-acetyltransferase [Paenibacillus sacheonensis]
MVTEECLREDIQELLHAYLEELSSPIDSFLEEHILASAFYGMRDEAEPIGYYAIHDGQLVTQFYVRPSHRKHAQHLFGGMLERHAVKALFVPTCDEPFLSLAIDKDLSIQKQAYFFQESDAAAQIEDDPAFRMAGVDDLGAIELVCGGFLDRYEQRIANGELFVYRRGSDLLGIGIVERSKLSDGQASIGMFTNEDFRRQGVGRTIIRQLRKWCSGQGLTPVCGCWYYNDASKQTLESAGMVTKTRLLRVQL